MSYLVLCAVWFVLGVFAGITIGRETARREQRSVRDRLGRGKLHKGHPGDPELLR